MDQAGANADLSSPIIATCKIEVAFLLIDNNIYKIYTALFIHIIQYIYIYIYIFS